MYGVVLMAALATSSSAPDFHRNGGCYGGCYGYSGHGHHGGRACYGCNGCYGCYGCTGYSYGCYGCTGYSCGGCYGCYGSSFSYGCHGCHGYSSYSYGCSGCYGCYGGAAWSSYSYGTTCSGCYGCYGGHSCYGISSPAVVVPAEPMAPSAPAVRTPAPSSAPEVEPRRGPAIQDSPEPLKKTSKAKVILEMPTEARLFIDGKQMRSGPERRVFQTPDLSEGQSYYYDVRVEVTRDGQTLSQAQRLVVRGGETATATFTNLVPATEFASK